MQVASKQGSVFCESEVDISSVACFLSGDVAELVTCCWAFLADSVVDGDAESASLRNVDLLMTTLRFCAVNLGNSLPEQLSFPSSSLSSILLSRDRDTNAAVLLVCSVSSDATAILTIPDPALSP